MKKIPHPVLPPAANLQPTVPPRPHSLKPVKKPQVPDHEVMRCIGRGSYGEVWLARGVTGAWRAVKVVRREDFESERTFEREFQGILSFEPISRDHEGLVDILHVGRNVEEGFYFYVMELADDRESGTKINVVDYEPHTLSSDKARKVKLSLDEVVDIGIALSEALGHLHSQGLSHRDIKPSNIIFVQKCAKLADIGLVAQAGQQTYVGTEGFVPPEGPGSNQADVYSLGMVLYEISTGKDRLCFPELSDDMGEAAEKKRRRMLNSVICKACDPMAKRRFGSAKQLAEALRQVRKGKYHRPILPRAVKLFGLCGVAAFGLVAARTQALPWPPGSVQNRLSAVPLPSDNVKRPVVGTTASVRVETTPAGAQVLINGKSYGKTPIDLRNLPLGNVKFTLKLEGYQIGEVERMLQPEPLGNFPVTHLFFFSPPTSGKLWTNEAGMKLIPQKGWHESDVAVAHDLYVNTMGWEPESMVTASTGAEMNYVRISYKYAAEFCDKLLEMDVATGRLGPDKYIYRPLPVTIPEADPPSERDKNLISFKVILQPREYGDLTINSDPPGANIYEGDKLLGTTPKHLPPHQTGPYEFTLRMLGYDDVKISGTLENRQTLALHSPMKRTRVATFGFRFENDFGMVFLPIEGASQLLVSQWETRVSDYTAFTTATGAPEHTVSWEQGPTHPVARVDREQCQKFCAWLTEHDHLTGLLPRNLEYRLPTDKEWSLAADLKERKLNDPSELNQGARATYVWGINIWPPPREKGKQPGNFSDISRLRIGTDGKRIDKDAKPELTLEKEKYDDGYIYTAPVGSFAPNRFGLYDLAGNVAEWVSDNYGEPYPDRGVTRGGSWDDGKTPDGQHPMLGASARNPIKPELQDGPYGFRCVIAPKEKP